MIERGGRYSSRIIVPVELRPFVGKSALWKALGGDLAVAKQRHKLELGRLQQRIGEAERRRAAATNTSARENRYPLTPEQIGRRVYDEALMTDQAWRQSEFSKLYTLQQIDWDEARRFRDGFSGRLTDDEIQELVGLDVARFRKAGNHDAPFGSDEWRRIAQVICYARAQAFVRQDERNEGNFTGQPDTPFLADEPKEVNALPVSLLGLLDRYLKQTETGEQKSGARKRWTPVFQSLKHYLGHDDANRLTNEDVQGWLDACSKTLSPKTIKDVYFAALRAVMNWAVGNKKITVNPTLGVRRRKVNTVRERPKGFTEAEALTILKIASNYKPKPDAKGKVREHAELSAAKRWAPWLAAFTGARIAELTQLRKEDVRVEGGIHYMRITPQAGSVKTGQYRDVPLHPQLVERGFLEFVNASAGGPLFFKGGSRDAKAGANMVAGRVSQWLQKEGVIPKSVQPNHAWRHRLMTIGEELGISRRVLDAIEGHASRTAGESYGDVTLKAKLNAISALPYYQVDFTAEDCFGNGLPHESDRC
ncbi:site-specific integrase [Mesorhizobium sp. RP14(2022)]|uniref:Site-specific integrase n=1 Tax=Mesorhizobium liriopis TaxID=2953882 RepID=A0ABT1C0U2_9HYPH|nr:site-specific integrase [Mesorhizobium liriopis]MCO6048382.1 site-specific integrase [Mesorhizobium liriopis]